MKKLVGLLGGSFNPAHAGHVHISAEARKRLKLPVVWWMVSPQNPLKSTTGMAPFAKRFASAEKITAQVPFIRVTDMEQRMNTRYTVDTLRKLKKRYPKTRFVWLMGADNLAGIHRWQEWAEIFKLCPILVLDRSPFSHSSLRQKAALRFRQQRLPLRRLRRLPVSNTPAWGFVHIAKHPASSTEIRNNIKGLK